MVRENFLLRFRTPNMEISKHCPTPQHIQLQIKETRIDYSIVLSLCDLFLLSERCLCWMLQNLNRMSYVITIRLCGTIINIYIAMICIAFQQNYLPFLIINNGLGLILCTTVNCVRQVSRFFLIPIIYNSIHCCSNRPKCAIIFVILSIPSLIISSIIWIECFNIGLIIPAKWLKTE